MDITQTNPNYPNPARIETITGKLADLWSMSPGATLMEIVEGVLGTCHKDECARLMTDREFDKLLSQRLAVTSGGWAWRDEAE